MAFQTQNDEDGVMSEINVTPLVDVMSVSYTHLTLPTNREV